MVSIRDSESSVVGHPESCRVTNDQAYTHHWHSCDVPGFQGEFNLIGEDLAHTHENEGVTLSESHTSQENDGLRHLSEGSLQGNCHGGLSHTLTLGQGTSGNSLEEAHLDTGIEYREPIDVDRVELKWRDGGVTNHKR